MTGRRPRVITRRRFLAMLGGGAGLGAAGWTFGRSSAPLAAPLGASPLTTLPPVTTLAPHGLTEGAVVDAASPSGLRAEPLRSIDVLCREAWGARPVTSELTEHVPVRMTIHHTATLLSDPAAAPSHVREHQAFHQVNRGWPDLAYHFIIDGAGVVYEGRRADTVGDTGTDYDPTGHLLVACEGNFDRQTVPDAQYGALVDLLAWSAAAHTIDPGTITAHRDWTATACPGAKLYRVVADGSLIDDVHRRVADGGVGLSHLCGSAATDVVAAIEAGSITGEATPSPTDPGIE